MSLSPGMKLGSYEILELIGKGGMGEVYKANDTRLGSSKAGETPRRPRPPEPFSTFFDSDIVKV